MVRVIVSLMARGRGLVINAPIRADIKGLSELEELFAVGVSAANEHRYLQTEPLESSTLFVGLHNADMVVGCGLFNRHSFGTPVLVLH